MIGKRIQKWGGGIPFIKTHFCIIFYLILFYFLFFFKCYCLGFPIFGGRKSTRALQATTFQNPRGVP